MELKRIGEFCRLRQGFQVPLSEQETEQKVGYVRFIRIVDYTQETTDIRYIKDSDRFYYVKEDDVVMVRYGAAGEVGHGITGVIANNMFLIDPLIDINKDYLYYFLAQSRIKNKLLASSASTTMPALNFKIVNDLEVPIYDKHKQDNIVSILNKLSSIICKRQKEIIVLDGLIKARFVELFGDPKANDKGFTKAPMGEYMTVLTDFSSNGSYKTLDSGVTMYDEPNYAWMVRTTDLESGDMSSIKYIDENAYELLSKSKIYGGEIIMNKIGSAGKVYLMPEIEMPASLGRNAFMFRYDDRINVRFLFEQLVSEYGQAEIQQYVRGAVTKTITKDDARSVQIIVPEKELQDKYVEFVHQIDESKVVIKRALEEEQRLFDSLMQQYFG